MRVPSQGKPYNVLEDTNHSEHITLEKQCAEGGGMVKKVGERYKQRQKRILQCALALPISSLSELSEAREICDSIVKDTLLLLSGRKMRRGELSFKRNQDIHNQSTACRTLCA